MKKLLLWGMLSISIVAFGCSGNKSGSAQQEANKTEAEMPQSDENLEYQGIYKGTIPAADGPGINITLSLNPDMTYKMVSLYQGEKDHTFTDTGKYSVKGNIITLDVKDQGSLYLKAEDGQLRMLDDEQQVITGPLENNYILMSVDSF